jgi:hypothetical protein
MIDGLRPQAASPLPAPAPSAAQLVELSPLPPTAERDPRFP